MWKEHGLDPSWVESIPFYEYQIWVDKLNDAIEQDNRDILEAEGKQELFNFRKK